MLDDLDKMPFGKYRGLPMQDVPAKYFWFLWTNGLKDDKRSDVANYILRNMDALKKEYPNGIWN